MNAASTLSIAGAKGGVGKTTTSLNLAAGLARVAPTVVVEFDLAMANAVDFLSIDCTPEVDATLHDVLADAATVRNATYEAPGGFDILPSGTTIDGYAATNPDRLVPVVKALRSEYEYVLIDVGAGLSRETLLPLGIADRTILVSTPRVASVRDARKTIDLADRVGGTVAGVVFSKSGTGRAPEPNRIASFLELELLGHVPEDPAVPAAQDVGQTVVTHEPQSPAARAFMEIVRRITDQESEAGADHRSEISQEAGTGQT